MGAVAVMCIHMVGHVGGSRHENKCVFIWLAMWVVRATKIRTQLMYSCLWLYGYFLVIYWLYIGYSMKKYELVGYVVI